MGSPTETIYYTYKTYRSLQSTLDDHYREHLVFESNQDSVFY